MSFIRTYELGKTTFSGYNSRLFNSLNDLVIDAKGRLYVTDPRWGIEPIEQPIFGVYRIDLDGKVTSVITNLEAPNGIAISPDQKTLYVTEHPYTNHNLLLGEAEFKAMKSRLTICTLMVVSLFVG